MGAGAGAGATGAGAGAGAGAAGVSEPPHAASRSAATASPVKAARLVDRVLAENARVKEAVDLMFDLPIYRTEVLPSVSLAVPLQHHARATPSAAGAGAVTLALSAM